MSRVTSFRGVMAIAAALVLTGATAAEEQEFRGELADGDRIHPQQMAYTDYYTVEASAGDLMTVTMSAAEGVDLDTYLYVTGPSGQEFSNDDDFELFGSSRVSFRVPEEGEWEIAATSFSEGETGRYIVKVKTQALELVKGVREELSDGDEVLLKGGEYADSFEMEVTAGTAYVVMMASADFDTYLSVHHDGKITFNDDTEGAGGQMMSLVTFTAERDGTAKVVLTSYSAGEEGRYRAAAYQAVDD